MHDYPLVLRIQEIVSTKKNVISFFPLLKMRLISKFFCSHIALKCIHDEMLNVSNDDLSPSLYHIVF